AAQPVVSPLEDQTNNLGDAVSLQVSAVKADSFTVTGLPAGLQIDNTGLISGTIDPGAAGSYVVTVTASNGDLPSDPVSFTWTVNKLTAVVTVTGGSFTYDGTGHGITGASVQGTDGADLGSLDISYFDAAG